jgi:hypothetical protein
MTRDGPSSLNMRVRGRSGRAGAGERSCDRPPLNATASCRRRHQPHHAGAARLALADERQLAPSHFRLLE